MNREKFAWIASIALVCLLAFQLPGTMAARDDEYSFVRTLVDIHRQVVTSYADAIDEQGLREAAINGLLSQLDPYSVYIPPEQREQFDRALDGTFRGVGIQLNQHENGQVEVVSPIEGSPAFQAGVLAGDIILKVNGESIEGQRLAEVVKKISGEVGTEVTLTVRHLTGEERDLTLQRQDVVVPTIKGFERNLDHSWNWFVSEDPKIAYVRITQFTSDTYAMLRQAMQELQDQGMEGLILDLRFNPGGRLDQAAQVVDLFIDEGVIVSTRGRNRPEKVVHATVPDTLPYFPMIVLINEHSASAAEVVAGSLMDNRRALVIGERSYGKGSVQELIPLDGNGGELKLTVAYYYLPSGRLVHRKKDAQDWGVEPQIIVPMTDEQDIAVMRQLRRQELFRRPVPEASTRPSTAPVRADEAVDVQLQQAVTTMVGIMVLQGDQAPAPRRPVRPITTRPAVPEPDENVVPEDQLPQPQEPAQQPDPLEQLDPLDPEQHRDGDPEDDLPTTLPATMPAGD